MFGTKNRLKNVRIAVLAADGFEKVELVAPLKALRAEGAEVDVLSLRRGRIRGVNLHEPANKMRVDKAIGEVSPSDYDGLFIPGGFINPDILRQSAEARNFVRAFDEQRKPIASLCHGPWVLASAGLLKERTLTSWPGIRDDLVNAGATWLDQDVVRDGNWVTSRGPQDLKSFIRAMTELYTDRTPIKMPATESVSPQSRVSSPQRSEPPKAVLNAMRWLPKPSLRMTIGFGLATFAFLAFGRRQSIARRETIPVSVGPEVYV